MSENRENNENQSVEAGLSASQPLPATNNATEIFSDATSRLLNDSPQKVFSNSQPAAATTESSGILKRNRKSLGNGRRVSFAATAHVRLFGNEEQKRKQEQEEAEEQLQLEAFRNQFAQESSAVNDVANDLKDFEIKSSPLVTKTLSEETSSTPSKRSFNSLSDSNQSFDGKIFDLFIL
jgi:hypothetical protein